MFDDDDRVDMSSNRTITILQDIFTVNEKRKKKKNHFKGDKI